MDDGELHRLMVTPGNAASGLFSFVVDPEAPATNNAAKLPLREPVVLRKIRGGCGRRAACWSCRPCRPARRHGVCRASNGAPRS